MSEQLCGRVNHWSPSNKIKDKLQLFTQIKSLEEEELIPYFKGLVEGGEISIFKLARVVGLGASTFTRMLKANDVKIPTPAEATRNHYKNPEARNKKAEENKQKSQDPIWIAAHRGGMEQLWNDSEFKDRRAKGFKEFCGDPKNIDRMTRGIKGARQKPEVEEKWREANSKMMKKRWCDDPELGRKLRKFNSKTDPTFPERIMIDLLKEIGTYTEFATEAQPGQVFYTGITDNRRFVRLENGDWVIPDFWQKGRKLVVEVYGDYWHGEKRCRQAGLPEYKWNPRLMIEEYQKVGFSCLVYWESELHDSELRKIILDDLRDVILN